jgi:Protein of unknown function (DUF5818)
MAADAVNETGILLRLEGGFALKRDAGGYYRLDLHRTPVDLIEKHVRVIGIKIGPEHVDADGVQPA